MKYNIIINQKALVALTPKITLIEASILDYLIFICGSENEKIVKQRVEKASEYFTWVNLGVVLSDLPLLHFKSISSVSEKISRLEKFGYLKTLTLPDKDGKKLYIKLTEQTNSLFVSANDPIRHSEQPHSAGRSNNTTKIYNTTNIVGKESNDKEIEKPFNTEDYIKELKQSRQRHIQVIGLYWEYKHYNFENHKQCEKALKRELKPATDLAPFSDDKIRDVMDWLEANESFKWTLETIPKYINEDLDELADKYKFSKNKRYNNN